MAVDLFGFAGDVGNLARNLGHMLNRGLYARADFLGGMALLLDGGVDAF